jgi:hypothetical protein
MNHLWQLLNPRAPDDLYPPDHTGQQISNNRSATINQNANHDFTDGMAGQIAAGKEEARRVTVVAGMIAADRLALRRTLNFVEKRWKEGATVEQTFAEAETVRRAEFDKIVADPNMRSKLEGGIKATPGNVESVRALVNNLPVKDSSSPSSPGRARRR